MELTAIQIVGLIISSFSAGALAFNKELLKDLF